MRIYLAGLTKKSLLKYKDMFPTEQVNVLLSFGRPDQDKYDFFVTHRNKVHSVILDSGAYTENWAERKPSKLTLQHYRDYALDHRCYVDFLFNLDSDFSEEGHYTDRINSFNQAILEAAGLDPVPVIHDIYGSEIADYMDTRKYWMLAIGSSLLGDHLGIGMAVNKIHAAGIKVHLFGSTSFELLAYNPVSSCDASSWHQAAARGYILFWNPNRPGRTRTDQISFIDYEGQLPKERIPYKEYDSLYDLILYLRKHFGFGLSDLEGRSGLSNRQIVNIHYLVEHEKRINEEHRKRGFFARPEDTLM